MSEQFLKDLEDLLNMHSIDAYVNYPDHIIVGFLKRSIDNLADTETDLSDWKLQ